MNFAGKAVYDVVQYPAADHAVKRQQNKTRGHTHAADPRPLRTRAQCFEGIDGVFTARTADVKLGQLNRQGYQNSENQKQKEKIRRRRWYRLYKGISKLHPNRWPSLPQQAQSRFWMTKMNGCS